SRRPWQVARGSRILAAAEAHLVEAELRPVRVVRPAAAGPGLGPVAALERRAVRPLRARRLDPLLHVPGQVVDPVRAHARRVRPPGPALPRALRLRVAHGLAVGRELPLAHRLVRLAAVALGLVVAPAVRPRQGLGPLARELPLELGAEPLARLGAL